MTAARSFWKETGKVVPQADCMRLLGIADQVHETKTKCLNTVWYGPGKYVLHVVYDYDSDNQQWNDLPFKYTPPLGAEGGQLVWLDWQYVLRECRTNNPSIRLYGETNNGQQVEFSSFVAPLFRQQVVREEVTRMVAEVMKEM